MKATKIIAGLGVVAALGVVALPLGAYAVTANETVTVTVDSSIYMAIDNHATETMAVNSTNTTTMYDSIAVATTSANGYSLTIAAATANDVNLTNGANTIPGSATVATGSAGSYTWGINGGYTGTTLPSWGTGLTMPTTSGAAVGGTSAANATATAADADSYLVRYGVKTASNQVTGSYTATNIFTAVNN